MRNLFILTGVLFSFSAFAIKIGTLEERFKGYSCKKEIKKLEETWGATGEWKGHIVENGNLALKRPTHKFANWIVLEKTGPVETMTLMNPKNAQKITFDSKCNSTLTAYDHHQYSIPKSMDDAKLLGELVSHKEGIIVLYSPGMNHSWTAIKRFQKIAKEKNLSVTYVLDPFANVETAKKEAKAHNVVLNNFEKLSSLELAYRDATMHYPNFFVYKDGAIVGNMMPGVMTEEKYNQAIKKYLGK
jgi:hypothetical protein